MWTSGQRFVGGHSVFIFDAAGGQIEEFQLPTDVANGDNQATILIATSQAVTLFGLARDFGMTPVIPAAGGKACFDAIDCVSWGSYSGSSAGSGPPLNPGGGITTNLAAVRDISGGDPNLLEDADDTQNSAADFDLLPPRPRNNVGALGSRGSGGVSGGVLRFTAALGAADNVMLSGPSGGFFTLRDTGRAVNATSGCTVIGATDLRCASGGVTGAQLDLGDLADKSSTTSSLPVTVDGGAGDDQLSGGTKNDVLTGGTGKDLLVGGSGADDLAGGTNQDTVSYAGRVSPVTVDIDTQKDDGSTSDEVGGRRDWVNADVENLIGGNGHDSLRGDADANVFDGGPGADSLLGGLGVDTATYAGRTATVTVKLNGVADDGGTLDRNPANNQRDNVVLENVVGGSAADTLQGNSAANVLTGGPGTDTISAFAGADVIFASDGQVDSILCGADADTLHADETIDTFPTSGAEDCETVD
jgi:Ca2+-binding RTX toxin-like protein